jgi:hypothetical protein
MNNMELWEMLYDATRHGYRVTFGPGHIGQMRVEIWRGESMASAFEPLGTKAVDFRMMNQDLRAHLHL